ncbi:MAG: DUF6670 family protein [Solirubrobacteraceae bacterium]
MHYNFVVPDLPEPHRFFASMVLMGQSGTQVFDANHAVLASPRDTATVALGTAATAPEWFGSYSISEDCEFRDDGSLLRFGEELEVQGTFPEFELSARLPGFELDLKLHCTDEITWFMRSALYDHVSLPARYSGTLRWQGERLAVSGLCSFEHAQGVSAISILNRAVPPALKLPVDLFTYQVLKVDADTLLLLTHVLIAGRQLLNSAYVKEVGGTQSSRFHGVECEILGSSRDAALIAPDGRSTLVPLRYRWRFGDPSEDGFELELTPDTPLIYGLGSGWIGGASYEGRFHGREIAGSAYYEHADRRPRASR